jgi:phosphatidyl-myo-inositol dimannoside synthase
MDVIVTTESRFYSGPGGRWTCRDGTYGYGFWQRYLDVFQRVIVVARCSEQAASSGCPVDGPGVEVWPLSDSHGAWGAVRRWATWQTQLCPLIEPRRAFILRLPGQIGGLLGTMLCRRGLPFGVEAIGDPAAVFAPGGYRHVLRAGIRFVFQRSMRQLCHSAVATSYVTTKHLQAKYPPNARATTTHYSSIELPRTAYADRPRDYRHRPFPMHLINVATMSQRYKGQQDLIEAVAVCVRGGRPVQLALVGEGRYRAALEDQVRRSHLTEHVRFLGPLPAGAAVRQALDQADVFVLPSLTEGLPRVLIEAQARALPCVATQVGGVPELIAPSECVSPARPAQLAAALMSLLDDPHRLTQLSRENLERAHRFASPILRQRRDFFYRQVLEASRPSADPRRRRAA